MQERPLISIVTVTWNSRATISQAIESVLSQDYAAIEYLVIDGASTDGTIDVVRGYGAKVAKFISEKDGGIYDAMNKGLRHCSGAAVLFLNSDDRLAGPDAISSLVGRRLQHAGPGPALCYSDFIKEYPSLGRSLLVNAHENFAEDFRMCHQTMLVDAAAYDLVGAFDTTFRYAADYDWAVRAKKQGVKFLKFNGPPTVVFRHGGATEKGYTAGRAEGGRVVLMGYGRVAYARYTIRHAWIRVLRRLSGALTRLIGPKAVAGLQSIYLAVVRKQRSVRPDGRK